MQRRNRAPSLHSGAFTLVELLLAVALLGLLVGAVAFNFSSLQQGQSLDQGADQFESLLRLARAHSSLSGHPVLVGLVPSSSSQPSSGNPDALALAVLAQPEPLLNPSLLTPIPGTAALLPALAELVQLEVQLNPATEFPSPPGSIPGSTPEAAPLPVPDPSSDPSSTNGPGSLPPSVQALITFHPDGSANPASFTLVSLDPSDTRRLQLSFDPISASFHRHYLAPDNVPGSGPQDDAGPDEEAEPAGEDSP